MNKFNRGRKIIAETTDLLHFKRVDECSEDSFIVRDFAEFFLLIRGLFLLFLIAIFKTLELLFCLVFASVWKAQLRLKLISAQLRSNIFWKFF